MDLQQVTNELVAAISRPVVLISSNDQPLASGGVSRAGDSVRLTIPIRERDRDIASFRIMDAGATQVSSSDYALLEAASVMVRELLCDRESQTCGEDRETVQRLLLADDESVRRQALDAAVRNRWIDRTATTALRAVIIDPRLTGVQRLALARSIAATSQPTTLFLGEHEGVLVFVSRGRFTDAGLDDRISQVAQRFGASVIATGASVLGPTDRDLARASKQARIAAYLTAALPEVRPIGWYEELGPWVMLAQVRPDSVRIEDISPAAAALFQPGNEVHLKTIEVFLDAGGRNGVACEILHVHRTTLYYRLDNAPQIVRDALKDGVARSTLHLALKLKRLWQLSGVG
jgi:DNA-binding PucR family transcriptional regulator